ncbi:MAG: hypothetical protein E6G92_09990 [Alphaproteobacteria bacterium]|nr:MAG: hypothetical protein E6G92_09990 [Alphaproteobacteria bacterium]
MIDQITRNDIAAGQHAVLVYGAGAVAVRPVARATDRYPDFATRGDFIEGKCSENRDDHPALMGRNTLINAADRQDSHAAIGHGPLRLLL